MSHVEHAYQYSFATHEEHRERSQAAQCNSVLSIQHASQITSKHASHSLQTRACHALSHICHAYDGACNIVACNIVAYRARIANLLLSLSNDYHTMSTP